jgi:hypothetical protein
VDAGVQNAFFPQVIIGEALTLFQIMAKMVHKVIDTKIREMGLVKKIDGLPPEIISDCLSRSSTMGPKMNAIKKGGIGNANFLIK